MWLSFPQQKTILWVSCMFLAFAFPSFALALLGFAFVPVLLPLTPARSSHVSTFTTLVFVQAILALICSDTGLVDVRPTSIWWLTQERLTPSNPDTPKEAPNQHTRGVWTVCSRNHFLVFSILCLPFTQTCFHFPISNV